MPRVFLLLNKALHDMVWSFCMRLVFSSCCSERVGSAERKSFLASCCLLINFGPCLLPRDRNVHLFGKSLRRGESVWEETGWAGRRVRLPHNFLCMYRSPLLFSTNGLPELVDTGKLSCFLWKITIPLIFFYILLPCGWLHDLLSVEFSIMERPDLHPCLYKSQANLKSSYALRQLCNVCNCET